MKYVLVMSLLMIGCVEDTSMYIDTRCTEEERAIIYETVEYVNEVAGYQAIEIGGYEKGVYGYYDSVNRILCVPETYEMCTSEKCYRGKYWLNDIYVAPHLIENIQMFKSVLLHEFGHLLIDSGSGEADHRGMTPDDVMYYTATDVTEYTARDKERIFGYE